MKAERNRLTHLPHPVSSTSPRIQVREAVAQKDWGDGQGGPDDPVHRQRFQRPCQVVQGRRRDHRERAPAQVRHRQEHVGPLQAHHQEGHQGRLGHVQVQDRGDEASDQGDGDIQR